MARRKKKRRLGRPSRCECGGPKIYGSCCRRFHKGDLPETPVELMKSRYSAYARGLVDYIIETTDPDGPAWESDREKWVASIEQFGRDFEFTGVTILESSTDADTATVTFRAGLRAGDTDSSFEETSDFVRRDGRWLYRGGDVQE